MLGYI